MIKDYKIFVGAAVPKTLYLAPRPGCIGGQSERGRQCRQGESTLTTWEEEMPRRRAQQKSLAGHCGWLVRQRGLKNREAILDLVFTPI